MAEQMYSRCWLHLMWGTDGMEKIIPKDVRIALSEYLYQIAEYKNMDMKANYVSADHVHCLLDLPANRTAQDAVALFKQGTAIWVNKHGLVRPNFRWEDEYGAFSVSQSRLEETIQYILAQKEFHRNRSFETEYREFIRAYKLKYQKAS